MANNLNNISTVGTIIAKTAATVLSDNCPFYQSCDQEPEATFGSVNGWNVGQTVNISKPARFAVQTSADITSSLQDVVEEKVSMTLNQRFNVPVQLTSLEIQNELALKDWTKRILKPAMASLGNKIDSTYLQLATNATANCIGTAGSTVFDTATMGSTRERLKKFLPPADDQFTAILDSTAMNSAVNARKGLFQSSAEIAKQYRTGYMGTSDGFNYVESNLTTLHTRGTATGSITVTTTSSEGDTTLALTGTGAQTLVAGDVITIASVFACHPQTKATYNFLMPFVVTALNTASSGTYTAVAIQPASGSAIYASSAGLQNVSALPQSSAVVTIIGSASTGYNQNLAYHKQAFRVCSVPLMMPKGAHMVAQQRVDGMTVRIWMDSIILTDKMIMRIDFLGAFAAVRPEWSSRITA